MAGASQPEVRAWSAKRDERHECWEAEMTRSGGAARVQGSWKGPVLGEASPWYTWRGTGGPGEVDKGQIPQALSAKPALWTRPTGNRKPSKVSEQGSHPSEPCL